MALYTRWGASKHSSKAAVAALSFSLVKGEVIEGRRLRKEHAEYRGVVSE
jgi:hypothetical protein